MGFQRRGSGSSARAPFRLASIPGRCEGRARGSFPCLSHTASVVPGRAARGARLAANKAPFIPEDGFLPDQPWPQMGWLGHAIHPQAGEQGPARAQSADVGRPRAAVPRPPRQGRDWAGTGRHRGFSAGKSRVLAGSLRARMSVSTALFPTPAPWDGTVRLPSCEETLFLLCGLCSPHERGHFLTFVFLQSSAFKVPPLWL